ncbi:hypothetical protein IWX90DRAFT_484156 [Phyllosticta citrichinensis]|uniref:Nonribosomal peptide synthetase 12 n=1 Tax=Phyllosticta citrichinensis TaxID=1130410 RepID=A0ABR1XYJ3_9PEZI
MPEDQVFVVAKAIVETWSPVFPDAAYLKVTPLTLQDIPDISRSQNLVERKPTKRCYDFMKATHDQDDRSEPVRATDESFSADGEAVTDAARQETSWRTTAGSFDEDHDELPARLNSGVFSWIRWKFFSTYRRIFTVVFLLNVAVGTWEMVSTGFKLNDPGMGFEMTDDMTTAASANLFVAILSRNEHVINALFAIFTSVPTSKSLWIRRICAMIYSYGGIHSGCGVAATFWFGMYTSLILYEYFQGYQRSPALSVLACVVLGLLVLILAAAHPRIRSAFHDHFEWTHRFGGWTLIAILWALVLVGALPRNNKRHAGFVINLARTPSFYFVLLTTILVAYPWMRLKRHDIESEPLSDKAIRLNFKSGDLGLCSCVRLSDSPVKETHSFAAIPRTGRELGFSCIVSNAGDWTRRLINSPPRHMWTRGGPVNGMAKVARLFRPVVFVATGAGIGPVLSFVVGKPDHPVRILWSTRNSEKTFGNEISSAVRQADPNAVIIDTDVSGRQNLVNQGYKLFKEAQAEAICVVSNPRLTNEVVFEMESRGIPAFGPIWDS